MIALVTGASFGIGEELALQLAAEGWNPVLVARRGDLLEALAERLCAQYEVSLVVLVSDLSLTDVSRSVIEFEPEIDLLILNAGFGYSGDFGSEDLRCDTRLVKLNCTTPMQLAHYYFSKMKQAKSGKILFVSSSLGFQGVQHMAQYSATKGYLINLGEALHYYTRRGRLTVWGECSVPWGNETPGKDHFDIE